MKRVERQEQYHKLMRWIESRLIQDQEMAEAWPQGSEEEVDEKFAAEADCAAIQEIYQEFRLTLHERGILPL